MSKTVIKDPVLEALYLRSGSLIKHPVQFSILVSRAEEKPDE